MSSTTIFPEKFLSDYHKMSEEDQLKLALTGYLMKISLNNPENTIFKRGDD